VVEFSGVHNPKSELRILFHFPSPDGNTSDYWYSIIVSQFTEGLFGVRLCTPSNSIVNYVFCDCISRLHCGTVL